LQGDKANGCHCERSDNPGVASVFWVASSQSLSSGRRSRSRWLLARMARRQLTLLEAEHPLLPLPLPFFVRGLLGCSLRRAVRKIDVGKGSGFPFAGEDQRVVGLIHAGRGVEGAGLAPKGPQTPLPTRLSFSCCRFDPWEPLPIPKRHRQLNDFITLWFRIFALQSGKRGKGGVASWRAFRLR